MSRSGYVPDAWGRGGALGELSGAVVLPGAGGSACISCAALVIFESERAEQYRGVPYLAPVIESLKQLTRYSEAEIMAAVINGFFTVFITTEENTAEMPMKKI